MNKQVSINHEPLVKAICIYIIVLPSIFDWAHGYFAINMGITITSSLYRLSIIVLLLFYIIQRPDFRTFLYVSLYLLLFLGLIFIWLIHSSIVFTQEVATLINVTFFLYCYTLLAKISDMYGLSRSYILKMIVLYGLLTSMILLFSLVFDVGIPTYSNKVGDVYGFGTQSYYIAGNVVGLSLAVSLLVAIYIYIETKRLTELLIAIIILMGSFSIGSITGMLISLIIFIGFLLYLTFFMSGHYLLRLVLLVIFIPSIIYTGVYAYEIISNYSRMQDKYETLVTGSVREEHAMGASDYLNHRQNTLSNLVGVGYSSYILQLPRFSPKQGRVSATSEKDLLDVLGAYGYIGLILFIPYIYCLLISINKYLLKRDIFHLMVFGCLLMLLAHSIIAGHVIFSTKSSQFASIFMVLALLTHAEKDQLIRRERKILN